MPIPAPVIQLPHAPIPHAPAERPTSQDVFDALRLCEYVDDRHPGVQGVANLNDIASVDDVANAHAYLHSVLNEAANIRPVGDVEAMIQVAVAAAIQPLQIQMNGMQNQLDGVQATLVDVAQMSAQAYNRGCGNGLDDPYKIIMIRLPNNATAHPATFGLPLLTNLQAMYALTDQELLAYMQRYDIPHVGNLDRATKIARLRSFIGFRVLA